MLVDARELDPGSRVDADVCVIGSGAAGSTVALELANAGRHVTILEAGGPRRRRGAEDPLRGDVPADSEHLPLEAVRERRLGGTTWSSRCAPLDRTDFERRDHVPRSGWPISLDDLIPFYVRAQAYCRAGLFEYDAAQALPGGPPFLLAGGSAEVGDAKLWRWSSSVDFGRDHATAFRRHPRLHVFHDAAVLRLERGGGPGVERAVVAAAPGRTLDVRARTWVIAGGGLESVRLLLASGLAGEHDLVGRFYMTHPVASVGRVVFRSPRPPHAVGFERTRDGVYCRRMLALTPEAQERHGLRNLSAVFWFPDPQDPEHGDPLLSAFSLVRTGLARASLDWRSRTLHAGYRQNPELGRHTANVLRGLPEIAQFGAAWARDRWLAERPVPDFMTAGRAPFVRIRFDAEQSPDPENRVVLSRERDELGMPRLAVRYRVGEDDRESIRRSLGLLRDELAGLGVADVRLAEGNEAPERLPFGDGTHQLGLARMAASPRDGVVDPDCRLFDAPNVYVAGSAVFPTSGFAAPTLTIVALASRVADHIARHA